MNASEDGPRPTRSARPVRQSRRDALARDAAEVAAVAQESAVTRRATADGAEPAEAARPVEADQPVEAVPSWPTADPEPVTAAPVPTEDPVDPPTGPAWSAAAAARPLPPLVPPRPPRAARTGTRHFPVLSVVAALAVLAAVAVVLVSRVHLGSTPAPPFTLNGLAAVAPGATTGEGRFAAGIHEIRLDADYVGAVPGDVLTIVVTSAPGSAGDVLPAQSHTFTTAEQGQGRIEVTFTSGQAAPFAPGTYMVEARHGDTVLRTAAFTVEVATPAAPTPAPSTSTDTVGTASATT